MIKTMPLQNIVFPESVICSERNLYFRISPEHPKIAFYDEEKKVVIFEKYSTVDFNTYFNSISISKWKKYTQAVVFGLKIRIKGRFRISLSQTQVYDDTILKKTIASYTIGGEEEDTFFIQIPEDVDHMISFRLEALEDGGVFYEGEWYSEAADQKLNNVKLGIVVCNYKRDEYVTRNLNTITDYLSKKNNSDYSDRIYIYVIDNGGTLDISDKVSDRIRMIRNKNSGGSGGFTRGIVEIMNEEDKTGISHVLLLDDDIVFDPESLIRLLNLLNLLKPEFADLFIGGSMLRLDKQNILHESGALWRDSRFIPLKHNMDLNNEYCIAFDNLEEQTDFFGWWCCCFPVGLCKNDNLPLPLFMRCDDVEFGLRNMKKSLSLNGICVWHEPFEYKYNGLVEYYETRNHLIINSIHNRKYNAWKIINYLFRKITLNTLQYKYRNSEVIFCAIKDYLRGPKWLMSIDHESHHKDISAKMYMVKDLEELDFTFLLGDYYDSLHRCDSGIRRLFRILTFNGNFLPADRTAVVSVNFTEGKIRNINFYRAKKVLNYDFYSHKGYITEKSIVKLLKGCIQFVIAVIKIFFLHHVMHKKYTEQFRQMTSQIFWNTFLGMDK